MFNLIVKDFLIQKNTLILFLPIILVYIFLEGSLIYLGYFFSVLFIIGSYYDDEKDDIDVMAKAAEGVDAIVFTAGSGPNTGPDKTMLIDLDGAVKTIEAAKKAGVKRYVMISSFDTTREAIQSSPSSFAPYVVAKHYADVWLRNTSLDYTIIHPGVLTNDSATGQITAAEKAERGEISREDVASVIVSTLNNDATIGKEFQVVGGDQSIEEAIRSI